MLRRSSQPDDQGRFRRHPAESDGFPDPGHLPSASNPCGPRSIPQWDTPRSERWRPFARWRHDRSGLGLLLRAQPRPRTTQETRRLLPTSATIPQSKSTPDETPIPRAQRTVSVHSAALDGLTAGATSSTAFRDFRPAAPEGISAALACRPRASIERAVAPEADSLPAEHLASPATPPKQPGVFRPTRSGPRLVYGPPRER